MSVLTLIRNALVDQRIANLDSDSENRIPLHRQILSERKMMQSVFSEFYRITLDTAKRYFSPQGAIVEIGAGTSFLKQVAPQAIISDVVPVPGNDAVIDAQDMQTLQNSSVNCLLAINCFHHLTAPKKFFNELLRILVPGGGCVLIEPYYGPIAKVFYRNLHKSEFFDTQQPTWESEQPMGVMSNANQALSYIVFVRDRARFEQEFPGLEIVKISVLDNYLRYLFSGGLNFKQLLPDFCIPVLKCIETLLIPLNRIIGLHYLIVIRKRKA